MKKHCPCAHSWGELKPPQNYKVLGPPLPGQTRAATLSCSDWGSRMNVNFDIPTEWLYPTCFSRRFVSGEGGPLPADGIPQGRLCHSFLFHEKCRRWSNCDFVHLDMAKFRGLARSRYCWLSESGPERCPFRRVCPYAHKPFDLRPPKEWEASSEDSLSEVVVCWEDPETGRAIRERVLGRLLHHTAGLQAGATELCTYQYCDEFTQCRQVHVKSRFWSERPDSPFPRPPTFPVLSNKQPVKSTAPAPRSTLLRSGEFPALQAVRDRFKLRGKSPVPASALPALSDEESRDELLLMIQKQNNYLPALRSMLRITPSLSEDPEKNVYPKLTPVECTDLADQWAGGLSRRYRRQLAQLLEEGQMAAVGTAPNRIFFAPLPQYQIGEGGTSEVYLAVREGDGMEVALKVLHKDEECKQFCETEVRALKVRNPVAGIVRYLGLFWETKEIPHFGVLQVEKYPRIALELMEANLDELVKRWKLRSLLGTPMHFLACRYIIGSILRTLQVLATAPDALDALNASDAQVLIHRDIKPGNVLLDGLLQVRIIDFGSARLMDPTKDHTKTKSEIASLKYMSPEVLDHRVSPTSDLFPAGLLLRFLLVGKEDWGPLGYDITTNRDKQTTVRDFRMVRDPHRVEAARHLFVRLTEVNGGERGFRGVEPRLFHSVLLAHPFFWDDHKATNFLVDLGNMVDKLPKEVNNVVRNCLPDPSLTWRNQRIANFRKLVGASDLHHAEQNWAVLPDEPRFLLKLVRNLYVHQDDVAGELAKIYTQEPYFLKAFPLLAVCLWQHFIIIRGGELKHRLAPYLRSPYVPDLNVPQHLKNWY
jgi:serine/threonine protein kinase